MNGNLVHFTLFLYAAFLNILCNVWVPFFNDSKHEYEGGVAHILRAVAMCHS
jgi:hypothetical protein